MSASVPPPTDMDDFDLPVTGVARSTTGVGREHLNSALARLIHLYQTQMTEPLCPKETRELIQANLENQLGAALAGAGDEDLEVDFGSRRLALCSERLAEEVRVVDDSPGFLRLEVPAAPGAPELMHHLRRWLEQPEYGEVVHLRGLSEPFAFAPTG